MEFQVGQLVKPITRLHRFGGGTLAMVIPTPCYGTPSPARASPWCAWFLWLKGECAGMNAFEHMELFKVVSK